MSQSIDLRLRVRGFFFFFFFSRLSQLVVSRTQIWFLIVLFKGNKWMDGQWMVVSG